MGDMRDLAVLFLHLLVTVARLARQVRKLGPGRVSENGRADALWQACASGIAAQSAGLRYPRLSPLEPGRPLGHASAMDSLPPPLAFFLLLFSGWVNRHQQAVIDYNLDLSEREPRCKTRWSRDTTAPRVA
jgi:hypothetical protein